MEAYKQTLIITPACNSLQINPILHAELGEVKKFSWTFSLDVAKYYTIIGLNNHLRLTSLFKMWLLFYYVWANQTPFYLTISKWNNFNFSLTKIGVVFRMIDLSQNSIQVFLSNCINIVFSLIFVVTFCVCHTKPWTL